MAPHSALRNWNTLALITVVMVAGLVMLRPLAYPDPAYAFFDDFYYYLLPAQHFLKEGSFAFFPGMPTNGFHPLWMVIIVAMLAASSVHMGLFFAGMSVMIGVLLVVAYWQAYRLVRSQQGGELPAVLAGLLVFSLQCAIASTGMEIALAVPLLLWLFRLLLEKPLAERTALQCLGISLLAALTILARLDTVLLLLPVGLMILIKDRPCMRRIGMLLLGGAPLLAYLLVNYITMHTWLPVSGQAKQLKETLLPGLFPLLDLFRFNSGMLLAFSLLSGFLACIALGSLRTQPAGRQRTLLLAAIAAVPLYYLFYCTVSDWPLWFWYLYPLGWLAAVSLVSFPRAASPMSRQIIVIITVLMLIGMAVPMAIRAPHHNWIYQMALAIGEFSKTHPGVYAMGDRAGSAAYVIDSPVLQLEGLIGDREFLAHIRRSESLKDVLSLYDVDYYIAADLPQTDICYMAREPALAGPDSPAMQGIICAEPLMKQTFAGRELMIFRATDVK